MPALTKRGSSMLATTGTTWANTANSVDGAVGTNPATYATWTNATSGGVGTIDIGGFDFSSLDAGATVVSIQVSIRHLVSAVARFSSITVQAFDGSTAIGTAVAATITNSAHNDVVTITPTVAQLKSANFKIRARCTRGANTTSAVWSVDHIEVVVNLPAPKTETVTEDFTAMVDTTSKWFAYGGPVIEASQLKLVSLQAYSGIVTQATDYDLRESYVSVKITPPAPAVSRETLLNVYVAGNAAGLFFGITGGPGDRGIMFRNRYASANHDTFRAYDPAQHVWFRVRLSGTTAYWDTSVDGVTWVNQYSEANTADLSKVQIELSCGQWAAEADTQPAYFDSLNITPSITRTGRPKVWNGSSWVGKPAKVWDGSAWVEEPVKVQDGQGGWKLAK